MTTDPDVLALIDILRPVHVSTDGPYTPTDRYRDFATTFGTDAGKRVLSQIIDLCEGKPESHEEIMCHALLAARAGRRRVGQQILAWASIAPRTE